MKKNIAKCKKALCFMLSTEASNMHHLITRELAVVADLTTHFWRVVTVQIVPTPPDVFSSRRARTISPYRHASSSLLELTRLLFRFFTASLVPFCVPRLAARDFLFRYPAHILTHEQFPLVCNEFHLFRKHYELKWI